MRFIKDILAVAGKDLALEMRSREILSSMLVFVLLMVIVFSFVFEPGQHDTKAIAGGTYWMALAFAGILGLGKSMQSETSGDNLSAMLLTPASRNAIFLGKVLSSYIFLLAVQAVMLVLFAVLYEVNLLAGPVVVDGVWSAGALPHIVILILLTTYGFVLLGTLLSLIAARTRTREIMLPILLLPLLVPLMIASVQTMNLAVDGAKLDDYIKWLRLVAVYDVVFSAAAFLLFEPLVEE
jgi:heme exporter protein B